MPAAIGVALQGFSAFERDELRAFFRLSPERGYVLAASLDEARFIVADAERAEVLAAVEASGRSADTVFVGANAPAGALARLRRPVDALLILRELDALAGVQPAPPAPKPQPLPEATTLQAVEPRAVMVVTPDAAARRALGRLVELLGLQPLAAVSSGDALRQMARTHPAFLLLDVELGDDSEFDGLALCRHIKQEPAAGDGPPRRPPQIVLLGRAGASERVLGQLAGCDAYLPAQSLDAAQLAGTLATLEPALFGISAGRRGRPRRQ